MSKIPTIIEQELKGLNPSDLDEAFLSRLTSCADESFTELSAEEMDFEKQLRAVKPRGVQVSLQSKLLEAIGDAPFSVDEKIVLFNKPNQAATSRKRSNIFRYNFAAAAAVALLGAAAALMLPNQTPVGRSSASSVQTGEIISPPSPAASNFAPASFNRDLHETSDEGVFWQNNNQPYRVYRQTYTDRVTTENERGETFEMKQPHIEHVLIPETID